jgi:hypothetical protein
MQVHNDDMNWVQLSLKTAPCTPKRANQLEMKASTNILAFMDFMGTAFNPRVDLSMMVSRHA